MRGYPTGCPLIYKGSHLWFTHFKKKIKTPSYSPSRLWGPWLIDLPDPPIEMMAANSLRTQYSAIHFQD